MKAIVDDMRGWHRTRSVVLFFGVRRSEDLYDLPALRALANSHPWLTRGPGGIGGADLRGGAGHDLGGGQEIRALG